MVGKSNSTHSLIKSNTLPLKVNAYTEYLMSALNLNAFLNKIETDIQGTLTGVPSPEDKVQVHSNLLRIISSACAGSISLMENETCPWTGSRKEAAGPSDQDVKSSQ